MDIKFIKEKDKVQDYKELYKKFKSYKNSTYLFLKTMIDINFYYLNFYDYSPLTPKLSDHLSNNHYVILFPFMVGDRCSGYQIRSLLDNYILSYSPSGVCLYGFSDIPSDFKYGDPIFLVEGAKEYSFIKYYNFINNTNLVPLALFTSNVSKTTADLLSNLTNNIIFLHDNDSAGRFSAKALSSKFKNNFINLKSLFPPEGFKDFGEYFDNLVSGFPDRSKFLMRYFQSLIKGVVDK